MKDKIKNICALVLSGMKKVWRSVVNGVKNVCSRIVADMRNFCNDVKSIKSIKDIKILKKYIYRVLIVFFAIVFVVSSVFVVRYLIQSYQHKKQQQHLQGMHTQPTRPSHSLRPSTTFTFGDIVWPGSTGDIHATGPNNRPTDPNATGESGILVELEALYELNKDVVGYLYIPGTNINYPVLHRPANKDYYLYRDILGNDDNHGSIYIREVCDVFEPSDNVTIYGHNMADGTMFANIHKFKDEDFFDAHPTIYFDTLYERHTYQVLCIFRTSGSYGIGFPFHQYADFEDEAEFKEFINGIRGKKVPNHAELDVINDSGISVSYGDKFICLSTCEDWPIANGRLVLVAVRIS